MAYVYSDAANLEGKAQVGSKQCVDLVKQYAGAPATAMWKEGKKVKGATDIKVGTAIATFVGGKYQSKSTGNHAALYLGQNAAGVQVIDQWSKSGTIRKRTLRFQGTTKEGGYISPSNNGDAFSVIE